MNRIARRGFTLVELLIVIAIIGTLVGLLLPAINAARARARQAQCLNNIKELALATTNYTTQKNGEYPGWVQVQKRAPNSRDFYEGQNGTSADDIALSWAARLLPELDQQGLWDQMLTSELFNASDPPRLEIYVCPADVGTNNEIAHLSYVANTGYFDNQPDTMLATGDISDTKANGLMHDLRPGRNGVKVKSIKDGAGSTLLYAENIHRDEDNFSGAKNTWLGPITPPPNSGSGANYEQQFGMVWTYYPTEPFNPLPVQARIGLEAPNVPSPYGQRDQFYARPASAHSETFNAAFAGGNAKAIRNDIEYRVYQQLMTPDGAKADALDFATSPPDNNEKQRMQAFMLPPLEDGDY